MQRKHRNGGFTLVEIMIVLAILVLLLAMVGPKLLKTQEKADLKITVTQIKNIEKALDLYKVDNRNYPTTEEGLKALVEKPADEARSANWGGPYMEANLPLDPWHNAFRYEFPPSQNTGVAQDKPSIWSAGPDGKDGTDDDIVNWQKGAGTGENGAEGDSNAPADSGQGVAATNP